MFGRKKIYPFTQGDLREYEFENGTRLFAELWDTCTIDELKTHARKLRKLKLSGKPNLQFDPDALISFEYHEYEFFVVSSQGEYMFFVCDCSAPDSLLMTVATHFNRLLRQTTTGRVRFVAYDAKFTKIEPDVIPDENAG